MKNFLTNKKIPLMLPLYHENGFVTDFKEKAELFNSFFSKKSSLLANHSKLPTSLNFGTDKQLSSIAFSAEDIEKIIQGLDHIKAHGLDNISICILKICGDTICKLFEMIFSQALTIVSFPSEWNKS